MAIGSCKRKSKEKEKNTLTRRRRMRNQTKKRGKTKEIEKNGELQTGQGADEAIWMHVIVKKGRKRRQGKENAIGVVSAKRKKRNGKRQEEIEYWQLEDKEGGKRDERLRMKIIRKRNYKHEEREKK